jgi:hypothetical protein
MYDRRLLLVPHSTADLTRFACELFPKDPCPIRALLLIFLKDLVTQRSSMAKK